MSIDPNIVEEIVEDYIAGTKNEFSLKDITGAVKSRLKNTSETELRKEIKELINDHPSLFPVMDKGDTYTPRVKFFSNTDFCISPSSFEIENGILFPGHRFIPFSSENVFPSDVKLTLNKKRTAVKKKNFSCPIDQAALYHSLLGSEEMLNYFVADHTENSKIIEGGNLTGIIDLTVFNFKEFYQEFSFNEGDLLVLTVKDWNKGFFTFDFVPSEMRVGENSLPRQEWRKIFEKALKEVIEEYGYYISIPEQLAQTYFRGGQKLLKDPPMSIDEFRLNSETICLRMFGTHCVLWNTENEIEDDDKIDIPEGFMISQGKTSSLAEIFSDIGVPLKSVELQACMFDELFNGGDSLEAVIERYISPWKPQFKDEGQEIIFQNFVEEMWENTLVTYNRFYDEHKGVIREEILKIIEKRLEWLNVLKTKNFDEKKIPQNKLHALAGLAENLNAALLGTINEGPFSPNENEMNKIIASIEDMGVQQDKLIANINNKIALSK